MKTRTHLARLSVKNRRRAFLSMLGMVATSLPVITAAAEFELGSAKGSVNTNVTMGTMIRTSAPDTSAMFAANAATLGQNGYAFSGQNNDDGNLNFKRGDRVSTVIKALSELRLKGDQLEGVLKVKAWHDSTLSDSNRPYGNIPNNYTAGAPLSDRGFDTLGQFSGIAVMDAYLRTTLPFAAGTLDARAGNQALEGWGERFSIGGGLAAVSPVDLAAARRPGALPGEIPIAVPMLQAKFLINERQSLEAFYQLRFRPNVFPGCGTFFSASDYSAEGCDKAFTGAASSDASKLAAANYIKRSVTPEVGDSGQFGVAYRFPLEALASNFSLHYAQYHHRTSFASTIKSTRANPYIAGDADGLNFRYLTEYAEKVQVWALGFDTSITGATVRGELSYRPNQPLPLNGSDMLNAFASNAAATLLRQDASDSAPGALFHGYDRFKVIQGQLAVSKPIPKALGAEVLNLSGELGVRHVNGLPDVNIRRYGRSTLYGLGLVGGACTTAGASGTQCSNDGYVTTNAWGYRLRAALRYPAALAGADLVPSIAFLHDVKGWSEDGAFSQGRKVISLGLRAEYQKKYFSDLTLLHSAGGAYDTMRDRDYLSFSVGLSF